MADQQKQLYDLCVVGAGMIGSAAARHASLRNIKLCLIGPSESQKDNDSGVFGAHYDSGRISRSTATDHVWGHLAKASSLRYMQLEEESGIAFYHEVGCLSLGPREGSFLKKTWETVSGLDEPLNHQSKRLSAPSVRQQFPFLGGVSDSDEAILESKGSGHLDPRKLIEAEQAVAIQNGCNIIREVVIKIEAVAGDIWRIHLTSGDVLYTRKVLVAAGAFANIHDLFSNLSKPYLTLLTQSVVRGEITEKEALHLKSIGFPSVIWQTPLSIDSECDGFYMLPPILYPDGKYYIKIGHSNLFEKEVTSAKEISDWFCNPVPEDIQARMSAWLRHILPDVTFVRYESDTCITAYSPARRPYIDLVTPGLGVALSGCGYAAKSCDEIGRLASNLMLGAEWDSSLPKEYFKLITRINHSSSKI